MTILAGGRCVAKQGCPTATRNLPDPYGLRRLLRAPGVPTSPEVSGSQRGPRPEHAPDRVRRRRSRPAQRGGAVRRSEPVPRNAKPGAQHVQRRAVRRDQDVHRRGRSVRASGCPGSGLPCGGRGVGKRECRQGAAVPGEVGLPQSRRGIAGPVAVSGPPPVTNPRLVCVLGMHRSGTSLITRMLNVLGVYLGPNERLMKPQEDNPRGYWEHQLITDLNDAILARLGGSWHEPPTFSPDWGRAAGLADLRRKAQAVIHEDFATAECWGWKDPRTCLTLPFWQRL